MNFVLMAAAVIFSTATYIAPNVEPQKLSEQVEQQSAQVEFVPGMVIVQFADAGMAWETIRSLERDKSIHFESMLFDDDELRVALFVVPVGQEQAYVEKLGNADNVAVAELNAIGSYN